LESLWEEIGKGLTSFIRSIRRQNNNPDNFENGLVDLLHQFRFQIGDGAGGDSPVVDGPDLVDDQIGIPGQLFTGCCPNAQDEVSRGNIASPEAGASPDSLHYGVLFMPQIHVYVYAQHTDALGNRPSRHDPMGLA
jgi:hypothetical protein